MTHQCYSTHDGKANVFFRGTSFHMYFRPKPTLKAAGAEFLQMECCLTPIVHGGLTAKGSSGKRP